jgi:predicted ester cyclase
MSSLQETAEKFFEACEMGKGWEGCKEYCHDDASFSAQADALAEIRTLEAYTEWLKGLFTPAPDASYEVRGFAFDDERNVALGYGVFRATHTDDGGPVPATGKSVEAEYVYAMEFEGDKIRHMTKIWNDTHSLKQIGWA